MGSEGNLHGTCWSAPISHELTEIIRRYGEERHARRVALAIVRERARQPVETTGRLREIVEQAVPRSEHPLKSVARVFQALRIAVNDELEALSSGLPQIFERLAEGARLVVISYHSLEDRIVKKYFRDLAADCVCPPDFPVCRCDKRSEALILTPRVTAGPARQETRARGARDGAPSSAAPQIARQGGHLKHVRDTKDRDGPTQENLTAALFRSCSSSRPSRRQIYLRGRDPLDHELTAQRGRARHQIQTGVIRSSRSQARSRVAREEGDAGHDRPQGAGCRLVACRTASPRAMSPPPQRRRKGPRRSSGWLVRLAGGSTRADEPVAGRGPGRVCHHQR